MSLKHVGLMLCNMSLKHIDLLPYRQEFKN